MGMGLGYLANASGANAGLEELIARQLAQAKFEEEKRQALALENEQRRRSDIEAQRAQTESQYRLDQNKRLDEQTAALNELRGAQTAEASRKTAEQKAQQQQLDALINDPNTDPETRKAALYFRATGQQAPANLFRDQMAEIEARIRAANDRANAPKPLTQQQVVAAMNAARRAAQAEVGLGGTVDDARVLEIAKENLEAAGYDTSKVGVFAGAGSSETSGGPGGGTTVTAQELQAIADKLYGGDLTRAAMEASKRRVKIEGAAKVVPMKPVVSHR